MTERQNHDRLEALRQAVIAAARRLSTPGMDTLDTLDDLALAVRALEREEQRQAAAHVARKYPILRVSTFSICKNGHEWDADKVNACPTCGDDHGTVMKP